MGVGFGWMPLYLVHSELKSGALREVGNIEGRSSYRLLRGWCIEPTANSDVLGNSSSRYREVRPAAVQTATPRELDEGNRCNAASFPVMALRVSVF